MSEFAKALAAGHRSRRGFRIAYTGDASWQAFEVWSHCVWEILDGNRLTYGLVEEYSDCCDGAGPLRPSKQYYHRKMWTQGRKYGLILQATSQRPQLISKDALGNAGIIWASAMDLSAAKRIAAEIDVNHDELRRCQVGQFFYRNNGATAEKIQVFVPK